MNNTIKTTEKTRNSFRTYWSAMALSDDEHTRQIAGGYLDIIDDLETIVRKYKELFGEVQYLAQDLRESGHKPGRQFALDCEDIRDRFYVEGVTK
jgi:hypothetical protein